MPIDKILTLIGGNNRLVGTEISHLITKRLANVLGGQTTQAVESGKINIDEILNNPDIEKTAEEIAQAICEKLKTKKFFEKIVEFQTKDIASNEGQLNLLKSFLFKVAQKAKEIGKKKGMKIACGTKDAGTYFETFLIYEDNVHNTLELQKVKFNPILLDK